MARERSRAVCVPAATIARLVGKIAAAPSPERIWPVHRISTLVPVELAAPGVSTLMSWPTISSAVPDTRKASEIQVSCAELVPRSCWNRPLSTAGMASATWATHTAIAAAARVPRLRRCV